MDIQGLAPHLTKHPHAPSLAHGGSNTYLTLRIDRMPGILPTAWGSERRLKATPLRRLKGKSEYSEEVYSLRLRLKKAT